MKIKENEIIKSKHFSNNKVAFKENLGLFQEIKMNIFNGMPFIQGFEFLLTLFVL